MGTVNFQPIALKEWAAAVQALSRGEQVFIMRKGGIAEETRHFQLDSPTFFFFPTYEHQKKELLKAEFRSYIDDTRQKWDPDESTVSLTCYAEVAEDIKIYDESRLKNIFPFHIWTERFAEERLRWKPTQPLHLLLLRVFALNQPIEAPILPEYNGCKSWIQLKTVVPESEMKQIVEEAELQRLFEEIRGSL